MNQGKLKRLVEMIIRVETVSKF